MSEPSDPSAHLAGQAPAATAKAGPPQPTAFPIRGHVPALDGVRGLAVLMVLALHFIGQMQAGTRVEKGISWTLAFGGYGVELFFVLSGYLITGILYDSRQKGSYFKNFYMRRTLRIFPLYYGVLAVLFFVIPLIPVFQGPTLEFLRERQAWAWLYGVNVYIAIQGDWALSYIDHFWSLCVEEHFYFFWPLLVWLLAPMPRRLMWTSLALSVGAMVARLVGNGAGLSWWTTYVLTPFRLDGLALGGFLAMLARQPGGPETIVRLLPRVAMVAGALFVGTYAWVKIVRQGLVYAYSIRASVTLVLLAMLLMWAISAPARSWTSRLFRSKWLIFFGTYSYGIYVYHHFFSYYMMSNRTEFVVQRWVGWHLGAVLLQALVAGAASVGVAVASYHLYEKRFLGLKRYFESGK